MQPTARFLESPVFRGFRLTHDLNPNGPRREAAVSIDAPDLPTVPEADPSQTPFPNPILITPVP